ncbi:pectin esterase [Alteromonas sp. a30]|nr:pectin esterase [Alteromonas sp. a30]
MLKAAFASPVFALAVLVGLAQAVLAQPASASQAESWLEKSRLPSYNASPQYDAIVVSKDWNPTLISDENTHENVDKNAVHYINKKASTPRFQSIQAALDAATINDNKTWRVLVMPGNYKERVIVTRPNVRIIGAGREQTRIYFDRYAGQAIAEGASETWGTFRTATVEVHATDVQFHDISIENSFDYPSQDKLPKGHPDKIKGTQAVALKVAETADKVLLNRVRLFGYQDTLFVQGKRTYVYDSDIYGHVDFIFGKGNALFERVDVISLPRAHPHKFTGYVTAPSTLIDNAYGLTFLHCRLLREQGVPDNSVGLGRPWHPTTTFEDGRYANPFAIGKSTYIQTYMDAHIAQQGWASMGGTAKDGSRKQFMPLSDARFTEFASFGAGALVNEQRPQLPKAQVANYQKSKVLGDWQPRL